MYKEDYIGEYRRFDPRKEARAFTRRSAAYWKKKGERHALQTFNLALKNIPAYRAFLTRKGVTGSSIKTIGDFRFLPLTNKEYVRAYRLEELSIAGNIFSNEIIAVSSGSSGEPFLWPRGLHQELETTQTYETLLVNFFKIDSRRTLFINAYSMGMYVAGVFTLNSLLRIAQKGHDLILVNPGLEKHDIIRIIERLGSHFEQIILAGYPPFVKDIVDLGQSRGIPWKELNVKFIFGGEGFSEEWRDYLFKTVGGGNVLQDCVNTYGSADAAILGHETPLSILVRRLADQNPELRRALFGKETRLPTLVQYYPHLRYFELIENELVFTANSGLPLVRYNIHDNGGILDFDMVNNICGVFGVNLEEELRRNGASEFLWRLPFLYLFGRSDSSITIYGLNVYPENMKAALENRELEALVTGRFTMLTEYDQDQEQHLTVNVELSKSTFHSKELESKIAIITTRSLRKLNAEYAKLYSAMGDRVAPRIQLIENGDTEFFGKSVKQKWVR